MRNIKFRAILPRIISGVTVFGVFFLSTAFIASSLQIVGNTNANTTTDNDVSVNVGVVLSITTSPNLLEFRITPTPSGTFMKKSTAVTVDTNNATGYTLSISDSDDSTALAATSGSNTTTIPSITTASTDLDSIELNTWGYAFLNAGSGNTGSNVPTTLSSAFNPIPTLSSPTTLDTTDIPGYNTYNLTIGTNIDTTIPAGTYADTLTLTATANYVPPPQTTFSSIRNMQDMTAAICAAETTPTNTATQTTTEHSDDTNLVPVATLTDTRDNNTYVVAKLADGKCWMTQNLRLGNTTSNITLTSADSDVTADFTIPTSAVQTSGTTSWGPNNNATAVNTIHVYNNGNSWIAPTSSGSNATVNTTGTPPNQSQYIGNYYNWYTATAGTGIESMAFGNASSSICPKGWKLPTGGANSDFTGLTGALVNITTNTDSVPAQSFAMQSAPNYFVLSGYYNYGANLQGSYGSWWSRTANSSTYSTNAYYLGLSATSSVYPQYYSYKDSGYSVRCIAQ